MNVLLEQAKEVLAIIEETIEAASPFYGWFEEESGSVGLDDCVFPDSIADPLALIRARRGDEFVRRLEYENDLEHIAHVLEACIAEP